MAKQSNAAAPDQINMIGKGTTLDGTLKAESDVRISGRVIGKIEIAGKVIVAQEGVIEGEIKASNLDVAGRIDGQMDVEERVVLKSSAKVEGDIRTGRLVVEEGGMFNGQCRMGDRTVDSETIFSSGPKDKRTDKVPRVSEGTS